MTKANQDAEAAINGQPASPPSGWVAIASVDALPKEDTWLLWKRKELVDSEVMWFQADYSDKYKAKMAKEFTAYLRIPPFQRADLAPYQVEDK